LAVNSNFIKKLFFLTDRIFLFAAVAGQPSCFQQVS